MTLSFEIIESIPSAFPSIAARKGLLLINCKQGWTVEMSERTPLLEPAPPTHEPAESSRNNNQDSSILKNLGTLSVCVCLLVLVELGAYLATIPLNQVLEQNICQRLHPGIALVPNDPICKENSVQSELSVIRGWQSTFDLIPGLLVAVPYGILADKVGREFVLFLASLGITLSSGFYILICM